VPDGNFRGSSEVGDLVPTAKRDLKCLESRRVW